MSDLTRKTIKILEQLVAFDTTSSKPNIDCIRWIQNYLAEHGVTAEIVAGSEEGKASLFATIGAGAGGIMLAGHSDVVPVLGQDWTSDPFTLTERDDKLYGRGSCDMKAFIACALAMVPELVRAAMDGTLPQPVHLAFTHDEESDMSGAANLTNFLRERKVQAAWVWIGEPTGHRIINSHKGVAAFETKITGVPAHSGKPDQGLNAIELGHDFITILRDVAAEKRARPFTPSRYDPAYTTINLGITEGGSAENIVAEHWKLIWQTRQHPGDDHDGMLADIESRAEEKLRPRFGAFAGDYPHVGCKTCTQFNIPPLLPTADNPGERILGALTGATEIEAVSFATEGGFFQKLGSPVVVCGPGSIDQAHKADEYVQKSQLTDCVDLIRSVLIPSSRLQPKGLHP